MDPQSMVAPLLLGAQFISGEGIVILQKTVTSNGHDYTNRPTPSIDKAVQTTKKIKASTWTIISEWPETVGSKISLLKAALTSLASRTWEAFKFGMSCLCYCPFGKEEVKVEQEETRALQSVQEMLRGEGIDTSKVMVEKMTAEGTVTFEVLKQFNKDAGRSKYEVNNEDRTPVEKRVRMSFRCDFYQDLQKQFANENIFKNVSYLLTQAAVATFIKTAEDKGEGGATCNTNCEYAINEVKDKDGNKTGFYQMTVLTHLIINEKDSDGVIIIDDVTNETKVKTYISVKREILISEHDMQQNWENSSAGVHMIGQQEQNRLSPEDRELIVHENTGGGSLQVIDTYFIGNDALEVQKKAKNSPSSLLESA